MVTAVAAIGIAVALGTTGCGAGQISQTANQLPAVNGANVNLDELQLRDVQILYPEDDASTVFGDGGPFEIAFVIANADPLVYYRLKEIRPEEGQVTFIEGAEADDRIIPPNGALRGGTPVGANPEFEKRLSVELDNTGDTVAAGLTTELTFAFEKREADGRWVAAGETTVETPVDGGAELERQDVARNAEPTFYNQHHGEEGHAEEGSGAGTGEHGADGEGQGEGGH
ncbi:MULTISPECIES: hypothetical protein [Gordonia]|uniref:Lipoprotein n=1 Tax=Gordonia terrae C-6 TaxID=1316928 RepID=R7YBD0_9ACTN|nr:MULTISPECIES: hypothetical protein [Gordonia]EON33328.1 hypothetical protein GTC6_08186 [Gordonia terrae C-6]